MKVNERNKARRKGINTENKRNKETKTQIERQIKVKRDEPISKPGVNIEDNIKTELADFFYSLDHRERLIRKMFHFRI